MNIKNFSLLRFWFIRQFALILLLTASSALAAGEVDTSFRASLTDFSSQSPAFWVNETLVQPDGKILVGGNFKLVNGIVHNGIVRLNADGSLDTTFNTPDLFRPGDAFPEVRAIALQSDGKILVGGKFTAVGGEPREAIFRLNADGSFDATFAHIYQPSEDFTVYEIYVYPDDRILVGGRGNPPVSNTVRRFNPNGTPDFSFSFSGDSQFNDFVVQPDGKIVVSARGVVKRHNANGSVDATFAQITVQDFFNNNPSQVFDLEYLPDGKIIGVGPFFFVNNSQKKALFRANTDGTIDNTFSGVQPDGSVWVITREASGKLYIGGNFTSIGNKVARLNADGTLDATFNYASTNFSNVNDITIQPDGNILVSGTGGLTRVNQNGAPDSGFNFVDITGVPAKGFEVLVQPDNKILAVGQFGYANGVARKNLARFNADGSLDTGFAPAVMPSHQILGVALQPDGKILVAGTSGNARRLNADGSLDVLFAGTGDPSHSYWDVKYLPSGKILFSGTNLLRFNADGSGDGTLATINTTGGGAFYYIYEMAVQPDGKIIIVGNFTLVNGQNRNRIARLNADGTLDASFNPAGGANNDIYGVALQADGKILIGGFFTSFNGDASKQYIARLNADGSLDASFTTTANAPVIDFKFQPDGKLLLAGSMSAVNGGPHAGIARLNADGTLDNNFNPQTNSTVWSVDQQTDGKIIYAGQFFRTNGISTIGIGRLSNDLPLKTLFDYDGDGKADVSVFRPSTGEWFIFYSGNSTVSVRTFGISGDVPVPADFDADGKTDLAIRRPFSSSGGGWWYLLSNGNGTGQPYPYVPGGDYARPGDFTGDGRADIITYNSSNGLWARHNFTDGQDSSLTFGIAGDKPVLGDFDGDARVDPAIYRPSTGVWWYAASSAGGQHRAARWGISSDIPAPADYDGDFKTDFAVYRPSEGVWYIYNSSNGSYTIMNFGLAEDKPVPADYDGDGKADIAVFRPSTGVWYLMRSTAGFATLQFGISTDIPTPNAFVP